ncbi:MAG: type I DNA topoisomerase [Syntrophobacteraceae bacterium]|nr:type I DNA topoisomerase [Syntrophobacteraceae bacterium]
MSKALLIVESPTKAKTLGKYLGKDYQVMASVGHVKDLPNNKLGIDIERQFAPDYHVIRGKKKVLEELGAAAERADAIFLGPDPDREGEAIAWHIAEEISSGHKPVYRVLFYELTQKAIREALASPKQLNPSLYDAQQARRILDRLVGYKISPILWQKVKRGLSAGRVQSVALRIICDREAEIRRFESKEYWTIDAMLMTEKAPDEQAPPAPFKAALHRARGRTPDVTSEAEAVRLVEALKGLSFEVRKVDRKRRRRNPAPPFITSTLQQDAARKLRFSAKQTMSVAQRLYEGIELGEEGASGLITYMRTDSTRLSPDAVKEVREYIQDHFGKEYVPEKPASYKSREGAQDAHEAIRPTDVRRTPEQMAAYLGSEQLKLYTLIWRRFVASQMSAAILAQTTVDIAAGDFVLRVTGSVTEFAGFTTLYVESQEEDENGSSHQASLPELQAGQCLLLKEVLPKQHFTQPPPRFSEASLIRELEEKGIGRPSTYATILSTIVERDYVRVDKQRLHPTELGWIINDLLVRSFPTIVDVDFTARMEKSLDEIESGKVPSLQLLEDFYRQFDGSVQSAETGMLNLKTLGVPTDLHCPKCDRILHIRTSRNGAYLSCSGYPECSFSSNYERDEKGGIHLAGDQLSDESCDKCGRPMVQKKGRYGTFLACSGYPVCKNTKTPGSGLPCPREGCDGELVPRSGRGGRRFYGCNRYPECKTVLWGQPVKKACPACGAPVLLEKQSKKGPTKWVCVNPACGYQLVGEAETETGANQGAG